MFRHSQAKRQGSAARTTTADPARSGTLLDFWLGLSEEERRKLFVFSNEARVATQYARDDNLPHALSRAKAVLRSSPPPFSLISQEITNFTAETLKEESRPSSSRSRSSADPHAGSVGAGARSQHARSHRRLQPKSEQRNYSTSVFTAAGSDDDVGETAEVFYLLQRLAAQGEPQIYRTCPSLELSRTEWLYKGFQCVLILLVTCAGFEHAQPLLAEADSNQVSKSPPWLSRLRVRAIIIHVVW